MAQDRHPLSLKLKLPPSNGHSQMRQRVGTATGVYESRGYAHLAIAMTGALSTFMQR
jgi:hypothetical protein